MNHAANKLSKVFACLSAAVLVGCGGGAGTSTNPNVIDPTEPVTDWQLVWSDEFDGDSIDLSKWTHEINCQGGGNNEKQCYTDSHENSFIENGNLNIVALPAPEGAEKPYTSARLVTKNKADFKYGRFEMRAKLPYGQGSWPAFWMLPTDEVYGSWPKSGEIDILEAVNLKTSDEEDNIESRIHGTLHYGKDWPNNEYSGQEYELPGEANPADDFYTYAIEWQEGEIRWYVDNYLFATQRKSELRLNSKDEPVGLSHKGWFSEYFDQGTGELTMKWDNSPFDQKFHLILNLAVGGDWPENVNDLGIDPEAFADGQSFEIDYVRVYQCVQNPNTGKGCETVRGGYDSLEDGLVEGKAPAPKLPSDGVAQNLTIFNGEANPNWPVWDCCGGSTPVIVEDSIAGSVYEFLVGSEPTVNGFISREAYITDESGQATPFDASPIIENGHVSFRLKVESLPNTTDADWLFKIESQEGTTAVELPLTASIEGQPVTAGEWQTHSFSLQMLAEQGLDLSAIDVVMIFPAWGAGEGAVYRVTDVEIADDQLSSPELVVFTAAENPSWPLWDCCGGSTPIVIDDEDSNYGAVAEFTIGADPTVMGFISRDGNTDTPDPFDASAILSNGVIQFDMKVTAMPSASDTAWLFKVESDNTTSAVEVNLNTSTEAQSPVAGQWQTYTFNLSELADAGLDVSAIDVLMIFPAWGSGEGAVYRVDNVKIYDPNASASFGGHVLFADQAKEQWSIWDCCGGSTPTIENDDTAHGATAEFVIGASPTVMGLLADDDIHLDDCSLADNGVVQFELKVMTAPNDTSSEWKFKIESGEAVTVVELNLTDSQEDLAPTVGQWQTYTYSLQSLFDAGLDAGAIDVVMVFPAGGTGEGAV